MKGGTTYRILSDQVGGVRLVVNADTGAVAQRIDYDAFGAVTLDTNPGFQPFGFAGGLTDRDTGLVRFGARDYDPRVGRWTSKDLIGFSGDGENLYSYVLQDPANSMDPEGLFLSTVDAWCATHPYACGAAGGALGGGALSAGLQYAADGCISGTQVARDAAIGGALGLGFAHLALARAAAQAGRAASGIGRTTAHGTTRIAGQGATRGGVLSETQISAVRNAGRTMTQADGATVRVLQNEAGRFNVVIEGERGLITTFENLSQKSLAGLAKRYGWK